MTREHKQKEGSFRACLASDSSQLQKKERKNSHRDKKKITGLPLSDGLDMTL